MTESEAQLRAWMLRGLEGDAAAHEALMRALASLLHDFYRRRMRGAKHEVEDLVQETLISIHTRRQTYERDRAFTPWLYAIARYRLIDHHRQRRLTVPVEDVEDMLVIEGFEEAISAKVDVDSLLRSLPAKQARAIRDTRIDGKSVAEAAVGAGIGASDLKVSVHRGLKALVASIRGK